MKSPLQRLSEYQCRKRGHDWFPRLEVSQFLPTFDTCLHCGIKGHWMPWGECLGGKEKHPLADHYFVNEKNEIDMRYSKNCLGPR